MNTKEFNVKLKDMRIRKLVGRTVFIHKIKNYEIWKVVAIDKTRTLTSNFTFKDEIEATKKFESITENY